MSTSFRGRSNARPGTVIRWILEMNLDELARFTGLEPPRVRGDKAEQLATLFQVAMKVSLRREKHRKLVRG